MLNSGKAALKSNTRTAASKARATTRPLSQRGEPGGWVGVTADGFDVIPFTCAGLGNLRPGLSETRMRNIAPRSGRHVDGNCWVGLCGSAALRENEIDFSRGGAETGRARLLEGGRPRPPRGKIGGQSCGRRGRRPSMANRFAAAGEAAGPPGFGRGAGLGARWTGRAETAGRGGPRGRGPSQLGGAPASAAARTDRAETAGMGWNWVCFVILLVTVTARGRGRW